MATRWPEWGASSGRAPNQAAFPASYQAWHLTDGRVIRCVGTTIRHYRIGERLGAGGMGEVFRGEDLRLGRPVALKFLPQALKSDPDSRARLLNEARAASLLNSPNIATTYDIGEHDGADFIVMEYVVGELLSSRVGEGAAAGPRRHRHRHPDRRRAGRRACARDRAPGHQERQRDADRARAREGARLRPGEVHARGADVTRPQMTMAGMVVGTVSYMAPEQALGRPVDHRADLFSLGDRALRDAHRAGAVRGDDADRDHRSDPPRDAGAGVALRVGVPASLDLVVARALEKDPALRYQSAREMKADLRQVAAELDGAPQGTVARAARRWPGRTAAPAPSR
jgi:eukaryotic-like serine/threonine-protein kinase